jgi:hypothetical protein
MDLMFSFSEVLLERRIVTDEIWEGFWHTVSHKRYVVSYQVVALLHDGVCTRNNRNGNSTTSSDDQFKIDRALYSGKLPKYEEYQHWQILDKVNQRELVLNDRSFGGYSFFFRFSHFLLLLA